MRIVPIFLLLAALYACQQQPSQADNPMIPVTYPTTATVDQTDEYHGTSITDPYRWLEIDTAADVEAWVKAQNEVTFGYLAQIPYRKQIADRYAELFNYPKYGIPQRAGEYYFFAKNDGLQNQAVWYIQKGLNGTPEVFLDPNAMSKDGTVAVSPIGISQDDKYFAYAKSSGGSDWQEIHIIEIAAKKELPDVLKWVKFSGAAWHGNGFFYSRYPEPAKGAELSGNNQYHSIYYHQLGAPQSKDKLVYEDRQNPNFYHYGNVTEDGKYFIMYVAPGTDGFATYYKDLTKDGPITPLFTGYNNKSSVVHNIGNRFLVLTDIDAPNYRLVEVDIAKPDKTNWKEIIPQRDNLLQSVSTGSGKLFVNYLVNATDRYYQMNYDGSNRQEIQLPGLGSAGGFGGKEDDPVQFYAFTSFIYPNTIFRYDPATGKSEAFFKSDLKFNPEDYTEKQVFYSSKDGTKVSMFLVHRKDLKMNGKNPTQLYGYGGFNISLTPSFSASRLILLENGGVYAMPNLRGGGEYGEEWHKAGMLDKKQNVFDDFIAAAEYLIAEKYTSPDKLAIAGGSNGGLLVGAAMTQRPELFAVAFPAVGVLDMLRYHKFTVGKGWIPEYGSSENPEQFKYLIKYSPLHNLKPGVRYPSTMITTADHDDRVVPAHSFKFAAQLQQAHQGDNPVLIRIETQAGHGAGKPTSKVIEEQADIWSFFFYNTNSPVKYDIKG
ncbi:MAG TPA: prolyl oligopeptidase family serine peptidase [Saprospiraceae bacterium]|nr:prolyl oligopeptidase family serine peptidase [Saprospiraceae bacterium]HMP13344.1 prolyl oligopeptidase family serine peptidase [Saprospiraceae bacterium]